MFCRNSWYNFSLPSAYGGKFSHDKRLMVRNYICFLVFYDLSKV